jgi:hypothetical protein
MKKTYVWVVLAALCASMLSGSALAQSGTPNDKSKDAALRPPTPSKPDEIPVMTYIAAVLVFGLMGFAALIPSKRGHQD